MHSFKARPFVTNCIPVLPGLILAIAISATAFLTEAIEFHAFGGKFIENLVLAIVMGALVRTFIPLGELFEPGISFCAKRVMEAAIVLLGASISLGAIEAAGFELVAGVVFLVVVVIPTSYLLGRLFRLNRKLAMLVACGNSICGNSAVAAVAPVIGAKSDDVASAIAFTAVLGVLVVLLLPLTLHLFSMTGIEYGVLSGLTVYAVPQVLAAAQPGGAIAVQTGTLVKLIRVLMLGPVLLGLATFRQRGARTSFRLDQVLPWFIIGFAVMMVLRSIGIIHDDLAATFNTGSNALTVIAMAGLGLTVDLRSVCHAGGRIIITASLSILTLVIISFGLIALLDI
ncbi:YeiH family protein [Aestuariispira ectoiniformans]|uniref:YeiH family protein n=1 Tax=Aestuariispira ectoiniformans TaxID=2775080 RepID=UPI0021E413A3|nr:putative sulfate exporter family transporter [Aestuariispira ectoiniformans]